MNDDKKNILLFCVGLNRYDQIYRQCIVSQQNYALRHGYHYRLINQPAQTSISASAWLKIPLLVKALESGYTWVAYVDADCFIQADAPAIESLAVAGKSLYMANGFSGRINSGVIIAKNNANLIRLLTTIYYYCDKDVPSADWGENGHIIDFAGNWPELQILDRRWNNNSDPELSDYIRHYSAGGPMRALYPATLSEKKCRYLQWLTNRLSRNKYLARVQTRLAVDHLLQQVANEYRF